MSVEDSYLGLMERILSYGHYSIGGRRDTAMHNIQDVSMHYVISLNLVPQGGEKLIKTSYTLDELSDLESKLVLTIGSKAENRAAVEQFLNVCEFFYCYIVCM